MKTTHDLIEQAILETRQRMVDDGDAADFVEINRGLCEDLAMEVIDIVVARSGSHACDLGVTDASIAGYIAIDPDTGCAYEEGGPFDRELLAEHFPLTRPPEGMTWDDMDAVSAFCGISGGSHIVVEWQGRFYDSEVPAGVDNLFDLPYLSRLVAAWRTGGSPAAPNGLQCAI
ncbi:hypothetical protein G6L37_00735 [Agrobacterium rubi]|nr:hypothetical protein [Agrobacterium rubi]NTF23916.1 hypothetical protein [Agrobacterium rubi]